MFTDVLLPIIIFLLVAVLTVYKKRKQVGALWKNRKEASVTLCEKELGCTHCGHNKFFKREGLLVTSLVMLSQFACFNKSARCFVCTNCGFIHWFLGKEQSTT